MAILIQKEFLVEVPRDEAERRLKAILEWLGYRQISGPPARMFERGTAGASWYSMGRRRFHTLLSVSLEGIEATTRVRLNLTARTAGQMLSPRDRLYFEQELDDATEWTRSLEPPTVDRLRQDLLMSQQAWLAVFAFIIVGLASGTAVGMRFGSDAGLFAGSSVFLVACWLGSRLFKRMPKAPLHGPGPILPPPLL